MQIGDDVERRLRDRALDPVLLEISLYTLPELTPADIAAAKADEVFSGDLVNFPAARRVKTMLLQLVLHVLIHLGTLAE